MEDKIEPSMESKSDYEEWLKVGNDKAKKILTPVSYTHLDVDKRQRVHQAEQYLKCRLDIITQSR